MLLDLYLPSPKYAEPLTKNYLKSNLDLLRCEL